MASGCAGAYAVGVAGVFGRLEAETHVVYRCHVVDLAGQHLLRDADQVGTVRHVTVVQGELAVVGVRVLVDVVDAVDVEQAPAVVDAVHLVALVEEELAQVCTVLTGQAGDEGDEGDFGASNVGRVVGLVHAFVRCSTSVECRRLSAHDSFQQPAFASTTSPFRGMHRRFRS